MYKWIICLSLLLGYGTAQAHQPDLSSTMLVEQEENKWVLQIRAALTGIEYEIHHHYGKDAYTTPEEFRQLVIKHVQENISILFNEGNDVVLKNGMVNLGHETSVVFEVGNVPANFSTIKFKNSSFKDISRNQSALIILKKGIEQKQFVLDNANQHTAHLELKDSQFVSLTTGTKEAMAIPNVFVGLTLVGVGGLLILLFFRNRKVVV